MWQSDQDVVQAQAFLEFYLDAAATDWSVPVTAGTKDVVDVVLDETIFERGEFFWFGRVFDMPAQALVESSDAPRVALRQFVSLGDHNFRRFAFGKGHLPKLPAATSPRPRVTGYFPDRVAINARLKVQ